MTDGQADPATDDDHPDAVRGDYEEHRGETSRAVGVGAAAGLAGGVLMGLFLQFGTGIMPVLGGLVGNPVLLWGWFINFVIAVGHGVVFALILAWPAVHRLVPIDTFTDYVLAGVLYGTLVATVTITVLPFAMEVLQAMTGNTGVDGGPSNPAMVGLLSAAILAVGHMVYGAVVGAVYATLQGADRDV